MSLERRQTDIDYGFEQPNVSVPAAIEQVGFSSRLTERLRELNYVLGIIGKPRVEGFNLELLPDTVSPTVEVNLNVKNPFKVEVMGRREYAAFRVLNNTDTEMHIADVQEFTRSSFPGRKITLCCLPRRLSEREGLLVPIYTRIPRSFYEEEQDSHWQRLVEEDYSKKRVRMEGEMFFPIEMDLYEATEELLANLQSSHEDKGRFIFDFADVTGKSLNFPYEKFQVYLSKEKRPLLELRGNTPRLYTPRGTTEGVPSFWFFSQLRFRGKPQNVEEVIDKFTELLKKTPQYQKEAPVDNKDTESRRVQRRGKQKHE